jgi:hypothetical protein
VGGNNNAHVPCGTWGDHRCAAGHVKVSSPVVLKNQLRSFQARRQAALQCLGLPRDAERRLRKRVRCSREEWGPRHFCREPSSHSNGRLVKAALLTLSGAASRCRAGACGWQRCASRFQARTIGDHFDATKVRLGLGSPARFLQDLSELIFQLLVVVVGRHRSLRKGSGGPDRSRGLRSWHVVHRPLAPLACE